MADQNNPPEGKKQTSNDQSTTVATTGKIEMIKREFDGKEFYAFKNFAFALGTCDNKPNGTPCELGGTCIAGQCHWSARALAAKGIAIGP